MSTLENVIRGNGGSVAGERRSEFFDAGSRETLDFRTITNEDKGRERGNVILLCGLRDFFDLRRICDSSYATTRKVTYIDFDENDIGMHLVGKCIEGRSNHAAGSAPRRREVENDEVTVRWRDGVLEASGVRWMDHAAATADAHHRGGRGKRAPLVVETACDGEEDWGEREHVHCRCSK